MTRHESNESKHFASSQSRLRENYLMAPSDPSLKSHSAATLHVHWRQPWSWFRLCDMRGVQFILLWCLSVGRQTLPFLSYSECSLGQRGSMQGRCKFTFISSTNCISTGFGEIGWLRRVPDFVFVSSCFCYICSHEKDRKAPKKYVQSCSYRAHCGNWSEM